MFMVFGVLQAALYMVGELKGIVSDQDPQLWSHWGKY